MLVPTPLVTKSFLPCSSINPYANLWPNFEGVAGRPMSGKADVPENYQKVSYFVEETDGGTRVSVEQDNNADEEAAAHSSGNWQMILDGLAGVAGRA